MHGLSDTHLEVLIEEATVDAHDEDEQPTGLHTMLVDHLTIPFETTVLATSVTVDSVDLTPGSRIIAWCTRAPHRQAIAILDLPLPGRRRMDPRLPTPDRLSTTDPARGEGDRMTLIGRLRHAAASSGSPAWKSTSRWGANTSGRAVASVVTYEPNRVMRTITAESGLQRSGPAPASAWEARP
ncbi:hypothetical protein [Streptomyces sp. H27-H5]|uniref:hypothetical protein n=1 Tax=Streptomyces sp. H27-H5 TaxID=2996460 RepID=UPI002271E7B8|nr:hypothetical protein [Streptomyces sp. H27-H5]MCY0963121.1 hypothetical protein [Streptomyces sp. H27-H5]